MGDVKTESALSPKQTSQAGSPIDSPQIALTDSMSNADSQEVASTSPAVVHVKEEPSPEITSHAANGHRVRDTAGPLAKRAKLEYSSVISCAGISQTQQPLGDLFSGLSTGSEPFVPCEPARSVSADGNSSGPVDLQVAADFYR